MNISFWLPCSGKELYHQVCSEGLSGEFKVCLLGETILVVVSQSDYLTQRFGKNRSPLKWSKTTWVWLDSGEEREKLLVPVHTLTRSKLVQTNIHLGGHPLPVNRSCYVEASTPCNSKSLRSKVFVVLALHTSLHVLNKCFCKRKEFE